MGKKYIAFGIDLGQPLDLSLLADALPGTSRHEGSTPTSEQQPASQPPSDEADRR